MNPKQRAVFILSHTEIGKSISLDPHKRVRLFACLSLSCNFFYALYHGVLGVLQTSPCGLLAMCAFYSMVAVMRFCVRFVRSGVRNKEPSAVSEPFARTITGFLLLILSVVLAGINFISLSQNIATSYDKITMITIATYTFYKIAAVLIKRVRSRQKAVQLFDVLSTITYAEVAASVLTLQRSMLVSFGQMEKEQIYTMNALTGAGVCLFILILGVGMIGKSKKGKKIMAKSKLVNANEKMAEKVTAAFGKIENTVVDGYTKVENAFVDRYLRKDGETVEEAKARLKREQLQGK